LNEALSAVPGLEYVLKHRLKTSAGALLGFSLVIDDT